jgi:hypothetical protein
VAFLASALLAISVTLWRCAGRRPSGPEILASNPSHPADDATLDFLQGIPLYRTLLSAKDVRSGRIGRDGTLSLEVDLRGLLEPRLAAMGFPGGSELFPKTAQGTIAIENRAGTPSTTGLRETWRFDSPETVLDLLDRSPALPTAMSLLNAIPGTPSALVIVRLNAKRLADPTLGGAALASWRDRANFAEKLLGHPVRTEVAEDLAGPAVFALYEDSEDTRAEAILALELRRSDRLSSLL